MYNHIPYRFHSHDEDHVHGVGQVFDCGDGSAGLDPDTRTHPGLVDKSDQSLGVGPGGLDVERVLERSVQQSHFSSQFAFRHFDFSN